MTKTDAQLDQIREYLLKNGYGSVGPTPGPILMVISEEPPFTLREVCVPRMTDGAFIYSPTAVGIAILIDNALPTRLMLDLIGMMCVPNFKTLAEKCPDEIAAQEKQSMECGASVHNSKRHPAMGLEQFEQALGRRQRGPSSEGTPPAEAEGEG